MGFCAQGLRIFNWIFTELHVFIASLLVQDMILGKTLYCIIMDMHLTILSLVCKELFEGIPLKLILCRRLAPSSEQSISCTCSSVEQ